ncbi:MAG: hypothetical protein NVSMB14_08510 [Isosphaeraceae bacterium]
MRPSPLESNSAGARPSLFLARLPGLPARALSARRAIDLVSLELAQGREITSIHLRDSAEWNALAEIDLAWAEARSRQNAGLGDDPHSLDPLEFVAERSWWTRLPRGSANFEARERLWRQSVAHSTAARRIAREQGVSQNEVERLARACLIRSLGLWAIAAIAPDALANLLEIDDPIERADWERERFGADSIAMGLDLAHSWRLDPLVVDIIRLAAGSKRGVSFAQTDPGLVAIAREAFSLAEQTPWALFDRAAFSGDSRVKHLIAETQLRCLSPSDGEPSSSREAETSRRLARSWIDARGLATSLRASQEMLAASLRELDSLEKDADSGFRDAKLRAVGEFAAGAGHELTNPLAVAQGRAQLLLARRPDADSARSLRAIIDQTRRAHRMLRDLMYVARPPEPRDRPCVPDEILAACVRDLRLEADARKVRLSFEPNADPSPALADPDALRHLADVLIRNAIEATGAGKSVVVRSLGGPTTLRWSVSDQGTGLSELDREHLFDPFYCGRQAGRGLGLGLPRAARFMALRSGRILVRSRLGFGSVFEAVLPLTTPAAKPVV